LRQCRLRFADDPKKRLPCHRTFRSGSKSGRLRRLTSPRKSRGRSVVSCFSLDLRALAGSLQMQRRKKRIMILSQ
jgi:hypothetical protein